LPLTFVLLRDFVYEVVLEYLAAKVKTSKSSSVLDEDIKLGRPARSSPRKLSMEASTQILEIGGSGKRFTVQL
jgi:hypothetical protein